MGCLLGMEDSVVTGEVDRPEDAPVFNTNDQLLISAIVVYPSFVILFSTSYHMAYRPE